MRMGLVVVGTLGALVLVAVAPGTGGYAAVAVVGAAIALGPAGAPRPGIRRAGGVWEGHDGDGTCTRGAGMAGRAGG